MVYVERGKLFEAQICLEKAHRLAPGEDYVLKHLKIVQNRIAKFKSNSNDIGNEATENSPKERNKVLSNKSLKDEERKTTLVVTADSHEQRYSSRVVNAEPLFVKTIDNTDLMNETSNISFSDDRNDKNLKNECFNDKVGTDDDDLSSGIP